MDRLIAKNCLAFCYRYGLGVKKDEKKAESLEVEMHINYSV